MKCITETSAPHGIFPFRNVFQLVCEYVFLNASDNVTSRHMTLRRVTIGDAMTNDQTQVVPTVTQ